MKKLLLIFALPLLFVKVSAQTVVRSFVPPSSVTIDNVGNYGEVLPSVTFNSGDFTQGCIVSDVDVLIQWSKNDGTNCGINPGGGNPSHNEISFRVNGPAGSEILALPGTWSGLNPVASVTTTFSTGSTIPSGTPTTGTFGPNNGDLTNFNGVSPVGNWNLDIGDNGAGDPLCLAYYQVEITTDPDVSAPVITVPADVVVAADLNNCGTTLTYTIPTATDNCSATVALTSGPSSGSFFPVGVSTVTYTASDPYGNSTPGSFTVTVNDEQNPVLTCPGTVFAGCNTVVNYTTPTVSDNCPGATVSLLSGPPSGGTFAPGTTTVTYQGEDAAGNTSTCSFDVEVDVESTPPTSITASINSVCAGEPITLTVNGGSLGPNAQWFWYIGSCGGQIVGAGNSIIVNPLSTANYYVRAEGPCNASVCADILIDVTPSPAVGFAGITSPSACGAADATITAVANGGTQPYTYTWSNGDVGASISGLPAGPYEVTVTDASGCSDFSSVS
ncbi:MAG: HYR domain-containing protein, partial [Flavobacteriales bacterium]